MKINTLGNDFFYDTDFIPYSKNDPEWKNFKQKIKNEKNINLETTLAANERIKKINFKIDALIFETEKGDEIKRILDSFNEEQMLVAQGDFILRDITRRFFLLLEKNIFSFLPCDIPQEKIAHYFFAKAYDSNFYSNQEKSEMFEKILLYFYEKNNMGFYEPSLKRVNKAIKEAFKKSGKNLDELKILVDTDKGNNLTKASTTWNTFKKVLFNQNAVFDGIEKNAIIQYKTGYSTYIHLRNFEKAVDSLIPQNIRSKIIEDILSNMNYLKSLRDLKFGEEAAKKKIASSSMEYLLYHDESSFSQFSGFSPDLDFFYYDRNSPDDMKPFLDYASQESYISCIIGESGNLVSKYNYEKKEFSKERESYFCENLCSAQMIGKSSQFFFKWYSARIKNAEYQKGLCSVKDVSNAYLETYDIGLYFAGTYTKTFVEEAIKIFLEEYKQTKRTGRIKEIYQYATALGLTMQLYNDFKEAGFTDYVTNPNEWLTSLWDSGHDVADIAGLLGLSWQTVQRMLIDCERFLKRNDKTSLSDLHRYITKWECDEYGIDTDEEWND